MLQRKLQQDLRLKLGKVKFQVYHTLDSTIKGGKMHGLLSEPLKALNSNRNLKANETIASSISELFNAKSWSITFDSSHYVSPDERNFHAFHRVSST